MVKYKGEKKQCPKQPILVRVFSCLGRLAVSDLIALSKALIKPRFLGVKKELPELESALISIMLRVPILHCGIVVEKS